MLKEKVYVTPDDYYAMFHTDLRQILQSNGNDSHEAECFIANVTDHLKQWIDANTFRVIHFDCMTPFQYNQFQKAILKQCFYTVNEGIKTLGLSSGIDDEHGVVIPYEVIREMEICPASMDCLINAGLFNLVMRNRPRYLQGFPEYGFYDIPACPPCQPEPAPEPSPAPPSGQVAGIGGIGYTEVDDNG